MLRLLKHTFALFLQCQAEARGAYLDGSQRAQIVENQTPSGKPLRFPLGPEVSQPLPLPSAMFRGSGLRV